MPYISKRAFVVDGVKAMVKSLWRADQGPAENLFRLISYAPSAFGLGGLALTGLDKILSMYGYGLEDFGRWLDGTGVVSQTLGMVGLAELDDNRLEKVARVAVDGAIIKEAAWGAIINLIKRYLGFRMILKMLWTAAKFVLLAFGFTHMGQIYEMFKQGDDEGIEEKADSFSEMFPGKEQDPSLNPENYGPQGYMGPRS